MMDVKLNIITACSTILGDDYTSQNDKKKKIVKRMNYSNQIYTQNSNPTLY